MARKQKHAHHGGAWKVAYADFVTAMMALFLVLWLTSQDEKIKEAVERSFRNPFATLSKESTGIIPNRDVQAMKNTQGNFDSASAVELNMLRTMAQEMMKSLSSGEAGGDSDEAIKVDPIPEGVRISIFDKAQRPIFEQDSANFTEFGKWVVSTLAWQVSRYTNSFKVELEGHTEQNDLPKKTEYGAWEISANRATATCHLIKLHGVSESQIRKVAGFAATQPIPGTDVTDPVNRRFRCC
jgi:chemotaxis protein MotB